MCSQNVFVFAIVFVFVFVFVNFFGQVMSPHHSDQMSEMSKVKKIFFQFSHLLIINGIYIMGIFFGHVMSQKV